METRARRRLAVAGGVAVAAVVAVAVWAASGSEWAGLTCARCGAGAADVTWLVLGADVVSYREGPGAEGEARREDVERLTGVPHPEHDLVPCGGYSRRSMGMLGCGTNGDRRVALRVALARLAAGAARTPEEARRRYELVVACPLDEAGRAWEELERLADREAWGELPRVSWAGAVAAVGSARGGR